MIRYHSRGDYQLTWRCPMLSQKEKYTAVYFRNRQSNARIIIRFTLYVWWNGLTLTKMLKLVITKIIRKRVRVLLWILHTCCTYRTRRYPWGIQRLVPTHSSKGCSGVGRGSILGNSKPKVPSPDQIFIWWGWGSSWPRIGYSWQNEQKSLQAKAWCCITDSLSHTMCVETNKRSHEL